MHLNILEDLNFFNDYLRSIYTFRKPFVSFANLAKMKLLQNRRCLEQLNGQQRLWFAIIGSFLVTAIFVLILLIMMCTTELSAQDTWSFLSPSLTKNILENILLRFFVELSSPSAGLLFTIHRPKSILVSLISSAMIFALTVYLVLLSLRLRGYHNKRGVRRCRVSSCLWTRRKVFWLQRGQSRTAFVLAALESSMKATKYFEKEARLRIEEVSTKYYSSNSNILKIITLAFIAVMTGTGMQIVNDS